MPHPTTKTFDAKPKTHLSPTTSTLKLATLAGDVRLTALEGSTEVSDGLTDVTLTTEQDRVGAGRGTDGELVEGQSLTAGSDDTLTGRGGESESGDRELGDLGETLVIENGTDNDDSLRVVGVGALGLFDDTRDGDGGTVDLFAFVRCWFLYDYLVLLSTVRPPDPAPTSCSTEWSSILQLTFDIKSLLRMTRLKGASVRRARKR